MDGETLANIETDLLHRFLELIAFLRLGDHFGVRRDHLDAVLLQHSIGIQVHGNIQTCLSPQRWKQGIGFFLFDDFFNHLPGQRLDIGRVGRGRIGHDRRRIAVDQHDLVAFFSERFTGLSSRIVKLASLTDNDWPASDEQNLFDVVASWHVEFQGCLYDRIQILGRISDRPPSCVGHASSEFRDRAAFRRHRRAMGVCIGGPEIFCWTAPLTRAAWIFLLECRLLLPLVADVAHKWLKPGLQLRRAVYLGWVRYDGCIRFGNKII